MLTKHKLILIPGAMGGLTVSLKFFITMYELASLNLMNCTCYVVISPSMLCALWEPGLMTVVDNELTITSYSLVRRQE